MYNLGVISLLRLIIIAVFISQTNQSSFATSCTFSELKVLFPISVKQGETVLPSELEEYIPHAQNYKIQKLGQGRAGKVYRLISQQDSKDTFVLKIMNSVEAKNDALGFEVFRKLARDQDDIQIVKSELLKSVHTTQSVFKISDVQGKSLFNVLADDAIPFKIKEKLIKKYNRFASQSLDRLNSEFGLKTSMLDADRSYFPEIHHVLDRYERARIMRYQPKMIDVQMPGSKIFLTLKSDNIIVDQNYKMFLIDPH